MKFLKIFILTISLLNFLLVPFVAFGQTALKLPKEFLDANPKFKTYTTVILEEAIGQQGGPEEFSKWIKGKGGKLYKYTTCYLTEKRKTVCQTNEYLSTSCDPYIKEPDEKDKVPGQSAWNICERVGVLIGQGGMELIQNYVGMIYSWAAVTIGIVSVLQIVIGGVQISASGGDSGRVDEAKNRITQSLSGLVLIFLSAIILYTVNPNFFV